jgi:hypothetical protein
VTGRVRDAPRGRDVTRHFPSPSLAAAWLPQNWIPLAKKAPRRGHGLVTIGVRRGVSVGTGRTANLPFTLVTGTNGRRRYPAAPEEREFEFPSPSRPREENVTSPKDRRVVVGSADYSADSPESTNRTEPVISNDRSEAAKNTTRATSSGTPIRPRGTRSSI